MKLPPNDILENHLMPEKPCNILARYITPLSPLLISIIPIMFFSAEDYKKVNWNQYITMFVGILVPLILSDLGTFNISRIFGGQKSIVVMISDEYIYDRIIENIKLGTFVLLDKNLFLYATIYDQYDNIVKDRTANTRTNYTSALFGERISRFIFDGREYAYKKIGHLLFATSSSDMFVLMKYLEANKSTPTAIRVTSFKKNPNGYGADVLVHENTIVSPPLVVSDETEVQITNAIAQFQDNEHRCKLAKLGIKNKLSLFLYGPPGTGKSSIATYVANELHRNVFYFDKKDPDKFFDNHIKCIDLENTVIVFDDVDFLNMKNRFHTNDKGEQIMNKALVSLLAMLNGNDISNNSVFIFTTNYEDNFDEALFRSGRVTCKINISLMTPSMWEKLVYNVYGVRDFQMDHQITLSNAVCDFILPHINDYESFRSALLTSCPRDKSYLLSRDIENDSLYPPLASA